MKQERFLAHSCRAIFAFVAFVFIAGTTTALAQTPATPAEKSAAKSSMEKKDSMKPGMPGMAGGGDMQESMKGTMKSMESMKMSGDTDLDFATMMKMHHQGAIDMAQLELRDGKDAKMREMAKAIIKAQQKEIKQFDQWLAKRK